MKYFIAIIALFSMKLACAEDFREVGSVEYHFNQPEQRFFQSKSEPNGDEDTIQLLRVDLSDEEKKYLAKEAKNFLTKPQTFSAQESSYIMQDNPSKVQLGMNRVPVLNQGRHGSCVTFAVTGALDALIGKGDYISQLCSLQLGNFLEKFYGQSSGWNGTSPKTVIDQITEFGVINKDNQQRKGCGGLKDYPTFNPNIPTTYMEPETYSKMNELVFGSVANWSTSFSYRNPLKTIDQIKLSLVERNRVVFSVLFPHTELGTVGAVGRYKSTRDSWILTPEILKDVEKAKVGHAMIITGYDDKAEAVDGKGKKHKGLFIIRNSWGSKRGNSGEFYMSYDYFKLLAYRAYRFSPNNQI